MTPKLEAAIAVFQSLSPTERQHLLQILTRDNLSANSPTDLKTLNIQFWQGIPLQQLRKTQTPRTVRNLEDFAADVWPEEDSIENFLTFLQQQRREAI